VCSKKFVDARTERYVAPAQSCDFIGCNTRAPFKAFANGRLEAVELAGVDASGLPSLDGREDFKRVRPPVDVDARGPQAEGFKFTDRGVQAIKDRRLAVVEKAVIDDGDASEERNWSRQRRRE